MKKNQFKMAGILVMALVFTMMIAGCDDGGNGDGDGEKAFFGETLTFDGQVWVADWDDNGVTFDKFTGNRIVNSNLGESGSITDGIFNFTMDTPSDLYDIQDVLNFLWVFNNPNVSPSNTQAAELVLSAGANSNLYKGWVSKTSSEHVRFFYVDKDITITGSGTAGTNECDCIESLGSCDCGDDCDCSTSWISKNTNLNLKAGWNALTLKTDFNDKNNTYTYSISAGDSSYTIWILD